MYSQYLGRSMWISDPCRERGKQMRCCSRQPTRSGQLLWPLGRIGGSREVSSGRFETSLASHCRLKHTGGVLAQRVAARRIGARPRSAAQLSMLARAATAREARGADV